MVDRKSNIYTSDGYFLEQAYWDESVYHVQQKDIPNFSIWRYNISQDYPMIKLISPAATGIPEFNLSYAFA